MSVNVRRSVVWYLACMAFVVLTLLSIHNAVYFSWLTARPPVGTEQGSRELSGEEISIARERAKRWFLVAAAATVAAGASSVIAWRSRGKRSKQ
jgi:hypothetical protein